VKIYHYWNRPGLPISFESPAALIFIVKFAYAPKVAHQAGAYPVFCSMKQLGVFLFPPGWDASPSQGFPQH